MLCRKFFQFEGHKLGLCPQLFIQGNIKELTKHSIEYTAYHLQLMKNKEVKQSLAERKTSTQLTTVMTGLSALKTEVAQLKQTGASTTTANVSVVLTLHKYL